MPGSENFSTNLTVCFVLFMYFYTIFAKIDFVYTIFTVSVVGLY